MKIKVLLVAALCGFGGVISVRGANREAAPMPADWIGAPDDRDANKKKFYDQIACLLNHCSHNVDGRDSADSQDRLKALRTYLNERLLGPASLGSPVFYHRFKHNLYTHVPVLHACGYENVILLYCIEYLLDNNLISSTMSRDPFDGIGSEGLFYLKADALRGIEHQNNFDTMLLQATCKAMNIQIQPVQSADVPEHAGSYCETVGFIFLERDVAYIPFYMQQLLSQNQGVQQLIQRAETEAGRSEYAADSIAENIQLEQQQLSRLNALMSYQTRQWGAPLISNQPSQASGDSFDSSVPPANPYRPYVDVIGSTLNVGALAAQLGVDKNAALELIGLFIKKNKSKRFDTLRSGKNKGMRAARAGLSVAQAIVVELLVAKIARRLNVFVKTKNVIRR